MKKIVTAFFVIFGGLALTFQFDSQTTIAQDKEEQVLPEVVILAKDSKLGKVTFNHANHATKNFNVDGTAPIGCTTCHHVEQVAGENVGTVYPADRTVTLTAESLKDPETPKVTTCRSCHIPKNAEPSILTEIPKIKNPKTDKPMSMTNRNTFHLKCAGCHDKVSKARPSVKAPKTMKCMSCHKRG